MAECIDPKDFGTVDVYTFDEKAAAMLVKHGIVCAKDESASKLKPMYRAEGIRQIKVRTLYPYGCTLEMRSSRTGEVIGAFFGDCWHNYRELGEYLALHNDVDVAKSSKETFEVP